MKQKLLRDAFWIWGHDAGAHHSGEAARLYHIQGTNRMGPWEAAEYLGIPNCCRVVFNGSPHPPFDAESEKLRKFERVVWSILGDASSARNDREGDDLDEVLRQAEKYGNVTGGILDDLFRPAEKSARLSPERLREIAGRLHSAPRRLSLWLVYYAALLEIDYDRWLEIADVITFWSWTSAELAEAETNLNRIIAMTPGKQHYAGCYIFNYGDCRPVTVEEMKFQLELYRKMLLSGKIQGVIVCANTVADVGLEAPEYLRQWLAQHGQEEIPGQAD